MNQTVVRLSEYPVVMAMKCVVPSLGFQLMAEIGDVAQFTHRDVITVFVGVAPV